MLEITRYSANSRKTLISSLKETIRTYPKAHQLAQRLFKRDIKALYRQNLLGFFWALIPPLLTGALWIFLKSNNVASFGETNIPYPVFVLTGTILWKIFTDSFTAPLNAIKSNKSILVKINVSQEGVLLSGIYSLIFNNVIKIGLLLIVMLVLQAEISWSILLFPFGVFSLMMCGFSLGLFLVPFGMLYGDVQRIISLALPFMMYLTPVIYPPVMKGPISYILMLNPVAPLLTASRDWLTAQPINGLAPFFIVTGIHLVILVFSLAFFKTAIPRIIERIGN